METPVGLRPRRLAATERMLEILDACKRFVSAGKRIPEEWMQELGDLNQHIGGPLWDLERHPVAEPTP